MIFMPRRKKLPAVPDYESVPLFDDKLTVQKSNPLMTLSKTNLTLPEFKILDAYLSRINSHEPDKRFVRFEKGELENMLGVSRIPRSELEKRLKNLFQVVSIEDETKKKGFTLIALFEKAEAEQDDNGLWQINLACTQSAMEYVFNVDNIGYLSYMLKNVIELTSRYSYILYLYLEKNRYRHQWEINIDELKELLNCTADTYTKYYRFNELVLKKCQTELNEKTSLRYSYRPTRKKCRKYTAIQFTIEKLVDELPAVSYSSNSPSLYDGQLEGQLSIYDVSDFPLDKDTPKGIDYGGELANLLGEFSCSNEFDPEQIRVLQDLVLDIVGQDHIECCEYLLHQVNIMNEYEKEKVKRGGKINNRYAYLKKMLEQARNKKG